MFVGSQRNHSEKNNYTFILTNIHQYSPLYYCNHLKPIFTNFAKTLGHLFGGGPQAPGVQRPSRATAAQRFFGRSMVGMMVGMTMNLVKGMVYYTTYRLWFIIGL